MNFFRRGPRNRDDGTYKNSHHDVKETGVGRRNTKTKRALFDMDSGNFNRRPSFGQWLKFTLLDLITMACLGAVGLGVYNANPAPSRSFPITFSDNEVVYPQFAYPLRTEIVPIWEAALLASLIPIAVILLMQIRIRSFWDVNNAIIGLLYSLITAAVFQVFVKWLIGGLRPHFLYVCAPDPAKVQGGGQGFHNIMFQRDVCTGDQNQINDSLESMPSGHSTAAWAGFLYLYFYLNAKLKVFSNYHPAMWKLVVTYAPLLGATLITGSLTIDEFHNWYDCLAGAVIGSVMAISAYRMVYASVWDFRFNHIPLTRHTPFSFGAGEAGAGGFESAVFTRKAGWGDEPYGGAPFDAAYNLRGMQAGFNNAVHTDGGNGGHRHGRHGRDAAAVSNTNHHNNGGIGHHGGLSQHNTRHDGGVMSRNDGYAQDTTHQGGGIMSNTNRDTGIMHNSNTNRDTGIMHNSNTNRDTGIMHNSNNPNNLSNDPTRRDGGVLHNNNHRDGGMFSSSTHQDNNYTSDPTHRDAGYTHDPNFQNQNSGIMPGHHRQGDIEHNAATGGQMNDGPNRYRLHSRSLERKALNRNSGGL